MAASIPDALGDGLVISFKSYQMIRCARQGFYSDLLGTNCPEQFLACLAPKAKGCSFFMQKANLDLV